MLNHGDGKFLTSVVICRTSPTQKGSSMSMSTCFACNEKLQEVAVPVEKLSGKTSSKHCGRNFEKKHQSNFSTSVRRTSIHFCNFTISVAFCMAQHAKDLQSFLNHNTRAAASRSRLKRINQFRQKHESRQFIAIHVAKVGILSFSIPSGKA